MKKLILAVLVLMLFALSAYAQDDVVTKGLVGKGIKAGVNLANATGTGADPSTGEDKKMLLGFGGGAFLTYAFSPMFAVQPEVLYMLKGVKYEETSGNGSDKLKFSFIEIPVLLKLTPQTKGNVKPSIFAGPFVGILVSAKDKSEGWTDPLDNGDFDIKDFLKSTEFGVAFGAGADFVVGKGKVTLDGRYELGLSELGDYPAPADNNFKTSNISFLVGYSF